MSSAGQEAIELAAMAGLMLDPWQQLILDVALRERGDGGWAAEEVGLVVPRQNGKGAVLAARELAGLFLLGERLIVHSAHLFDTSREHMRRVIELIEGCDDLSRRVKRVSQAHGEEGIELIGGQRIRFRTRTKGGGRGLSGDCVVLDEAEDIPEAVHAAVKPITSARPNPQTWYAGSAPDRLVQEHAIVLARVRARALAGLSDSLAYFEWSVDAASPDDLLDEMFEDADAIAESNPALGYRLRLERILNELDSMDRRSGAVERLGAGDWPDIGEQGSVIPLELWRALADEDSKIAGEAHLSFDISPSRTQASISVAGRRADGLPQIEVLERGKGTGWICDALKSWDEKLRPRRIVYDEASPASALARELGGAGIRVRPVKAAQHAVACGLIFDKVQQAALRHLGQRDLESAIKGAQQRALGERWAWSRRTSAVDITPLVSCTLALGALLTAPSGEAVGFA